MKFLFQNNNILEEKLMYTFFIFVLANFISPKHQYFTATLLVSKIKYQDIVVVYFHTVENISECQELNICRS